MPFAAEQLTFDDGLWTIAISIPWDHWYPIGWPTAYNFKFAIECCIGVQQSPPMLLGWHNFKVFVVLLSKCLELYLPSPVWRSNGCDSAFALGDQAPPSLLKICLFWCRALPTTTCGTFPSQSVMFRLFVRFFIAVTLRSCWLPQW